MKKNRVYAAPLTMLLLVAMLLAGCSGAGTSYSSAALNSISGMSGASKDSAAGWYDADYDYGYPMEVEAQNLSAGSIKPPVNVKLIYTADINLESTEFDNAAAGLEALTAELGGWFESSNLNNSNSDYRWSSYTIRLPASKFSDFCSRVGDICKVKRITTSSEDVSERYYDMESRLATQRTKLERLQELLTQAKELEDIITLESAISETELAIENLTGSLRKYDSLVDYATINLSLDEVYQLTPTEEPVIGFGNKLAEAFRSGTQRFVTGMQNLMLGFARAWAGWLLFAAIVAGVVALIRRTRHRSAAGVKGKMPRRRPSLPLSKQKKDAAKEDKSQEDLPSE